MLNIHGPPRCVKVVDGRQPLLDVDASSELGGRADYDPGQPVVSGLEEAETCLARLRLVDEADRVGRNAAHGELALQIGVDVGEQADLLGRVGTDDHRSLVVAGGTCIHGLRCTEIKEDELDPAIDFRAAVDPYDLVGSQVELAA